MIRKSAKISALSSIVVLLSLLLSGCSMLKLGSSYDKHFFVLEADHQEKPAASDGKEILIVRKLTIDSSFKFKGLIYRNAEHEYKTDFYNEFLVPPASMITEQTRNWLSQSGLFRTVLESASYMEATYALEGNILSLYGDYRNAASPKAVMEISFFLIGTASSEPSIALAEKYKAAIDLQGEETEDLIKAFDACLEQILAELERDIEEAL